MAMFRLTQLALADLRSIGRYPQMNWGREQRNRYVAKLDECFHLLAEKPLRGVSCDDLRSGYRKYPVGRHIVFYREAQALQAKIKRASCKNVMIFQSDVLQIGDIVAGRIVTIEQTGVLVDFEMDRPIHVPLVELSMNEIQAPEDALQLNEVREFLVVGNYDGNHDIFFSHCSPETLKDSDRLYKEAYYQVSRKYSYDVCELSVILHTKILSAHGGGVSARLQWFLGSQEHPPTVSFSIRQLEIRKAWERVQQLHTEEAILSTKIIKKGVTSILVKIEGLIGSVRTCVSKHRDELAEGNELPFRIITVEEDYNRIVLIPVTEIF